MSNVSRPQTVRDLVRRIFSEYAASVPELSETLLIRDGHYCGYRFCDGVTTAVWFVEEAEVKFYNASGSIARVVDLSQEQPVPRRAA